MTAVTQGSVRYETTNRRSRIPIGTAHSRGRASGPGPAFGNRRPAGLRVHDTMTNVEKTRGGSQAALPSPASRCDATAPENWKKETAYAHSLSRGNLGDMIAAAPPICHTRNVGVIKRVSQVVLLDARPFDLQKVP